MTFEPTQPQDGVDPNMFTLIDPEAIPYPLTDVWSLNYAAETLRTGGENLLGGAEDMHSTWAGLQAHYVAPESETLFAAMDPVVTRGEDIQSDLATVADALEELAEAASTARSSLNTLRIEAQSFWNKHHDKKVWWLDKDDETDEWALQENIRLKDGVNTAWAAFNEAENACATRISALFGGPSYASPDQAGGDDVLVYGLPTDAGEREAPGFDETFMDPANDFTAWLGTEFHPSMASFSNSTDQAAWDILVVDGLWGSAVGLASLSGLWHPQGGWQITPSGRWENAKNTVKDGWMDAMTFIGVHDEQGWVADGAEGTRWDRWTTNIGASWDQAVEGHTAWSRREEDPEYTGSTSVLNTALMTVGIPLKIGTTVLTLGPGGEAITPSNRDGSYSDGNGQSSQTGGRLPVGPSSPLPQRLEEGSTPIGERFRHDLTLLRESLLDPDQYRNTPAPRPDAPSPSPNRPVVGDGGDQPSPTTPQRGDTPQGQGEGTSPDRPRVEDTDTPRRPDQDTEALAPTTRPDTEGQRGDNAEQRAEDGPEQRPTSRTDDEGTDGQGDDRPVRRDDAPSEEPARPETATGGGEGGGDQPPRDRTTTGGDDGENADSGEENISPPSDPDLERRLDKAEKAENGLRDANLSEEEILALRGDHPRDGDQWQRVASALSQKFGGGVANDMHPRATRFAMEGAENPREFAYRYEYFKATFDELATELQESGVSKRDSQRNVASEMTDDFVAQRLEQDHAAVEQKRPDQPARVDTELPPEEFEQAIRDQAGNIGMGHQTSTAYHARKHYDEIQPWEQGGSIVDDYMDSAEETIRSGEIRSREPLDGGGERLEIVRPKLDLDGNQVIDKRKKKEVFLRAIVIVKEDGSIVMPTYGNTVFKD
ncbi:hypothetical protein ABZ234_15440 [Nocardiopsis sp. NPDC006198]|uniref:hypothetical protein n=1 Tax=Nocardiopsis sp. NPDC006198 TaxID=3154472 RepID=UPI0033AAD02F